VAAGGVRKRTNFSQGWYELINPSKYIGDKNKIRYMSSWEYHTHKFFDQNPMVLRWSSEPIGIPYIKPTDGKVHKYYVDYYCEYIDVHGEIHKELVELKPLSQTKLPRANADVFEKLTYAVNMAKWEAAEMYAKQNGFKFRIITENSVYK
jgi:hypothetical protein